MKESLVATDLKGITDPGVQAPTLRLRNSDFTAL